MLPKFLNLWCTYYLISRTVTILEISPMIRLCCMVTLTLIEKGRLSRKPDIITWTFWAKNSLSLATKRKFERLSIWPKRKQTCAVSCLPRVTAIGFNSSLDENSLHLTASRKEAPLYYNHKNWILLWTMMSLKYTFSLKLPENLA